jgi:hypothetical protein
MIGRLVAGGSDLGVQLQRALDLPLREYLRSLIPAPQTQPNVHMLRLATALERYLVRHGDEDVSAVCDHLLRVPVIQQADHSNLVLEAETFLNNWVFHLASSEAGAKVAITNQCSIVSTLGRPSPPLGPNFLRTRGTLFGVYPLSKKYLKSARFCALPGPLTMTFDVLDGSAYDVAADPVLSRLVGLTAPDAPTGYRRANDQIWADIDVDQDVRRVQIDDGLAAECVADHLEDPDSPIFQLIFNPQVRDAFVAVKRRLVDSPDNVVVNRAAPDFLWFRSGNRLRSVELVGTGSDAWFAELHGQPLPVPYEPAAIASALRAGVLYVDRVLAYIVRCLLPGITAIGGTAQQDYVLLYRRMLLETHAEVPFLDTDDLARIRRTDHSRLGGRPLLELTREEFTGIRTLGPSSALSELAKTFLDRPVGETIGDLKCARYIERAMEARAGATEAADPA